MSSPYAHMNQELLTIVEADQQDRHSQGLPEDIRERDRARRQRVREIVAEGGLTNSDDFLAAALVFQHGEALEDFQQAHQLALRSKELGHPLGAWLSAVAMDRYLNRQGKPVKYGSQYVRMAGIYRVPRLDPATTDEERQAWDIPTRADLLAMDKGRGMPETARLGELEVPGLKVQVLSLPRPLTWHNDMVPGREPTGLTTPAGLPVWTNAQGWHWAEDAGGQFVLGWTAIPHGPVLGHMAVCAEKAELEAGEVAGRPAVWVNTFDSLWTLYVVAPGGDSVWAVTGIDRQEVARQAGDLVC